MPAGDPDSIHLTLLPEAGARDEALEREMATVRSLAEAARALRSKVNIPTRHPLGRAVLVGPEPGRFGAILQDEINVKALEAAPDAGAFKQFVAKPNRAALGKAFKKLAGPIADAIEGLDGDTAHRLLTAGKTVGVNVEGQDHNLSAEHVLFEERDRPGWATTKVGDTILALHVLRDAKLLAEALVREVVRRIQEVRKELDLPIAEEVDVEIGCGPDQEAQLQQFLHVVKAEVRARHLAFGPAAKGPAWDIDGAVVRAEVRPTRTVRPAAVEAA